jgi:hypothetical protein
MGSFFVETLPVFTNPSEFVNTVDEE